MKRVSRFILNKKMSPFFSCSLFLTEEEAVGEVRVVLDASRNNFLHQLGHVLTTPWFN